MEKSPKSISATRVAKTKEEMVKLFQKMPIVQSVCDKVGIPRSTFYRWKNEDATFDKMVTEAIELGREVVDDLIENKHIALIQKENWAAIKYGLEKKKSTQNREEKDTKKLSLMDLSKKLAEEEEKEKKNSL